MADRTKAKTAEERWLIGGIIFTTVFISWIREPERHSVIGFIVMAAAGAGVFGVYLAAHAIGKLVRRPKA